MVKISGEEKKKYKIQPPPANIIFEYGKDDIAKYMEENGFAVMGERKRAEEEKVESRWQGELDFYIREKACHKFLRHCYEMALHGKEAMGFLIGDVRQWNGIYSIVHDAITASLDASPVYVRFSKEAYEEIFDKLDEIDYEYVIVGWYHSHLGYTSFMSSIDIETQRKYFNQPFHAAIVVDPIEKQMKSFRLINNECIEIPYAIFR